VALTVEVAVTEMIVIGVVLIVVEIGVSRQLQMLPAMALAVESRVLKIALPPACVVVVILVVVCEGVVLGARAAVASVVGFVFAVLTAVVETACFASVRFAA
jgi:hypothetical protein